MHTSAKCQRHDCHNTVTQPQSGRPKRFCSDACRIRVHRSSKRNEIPGRANGHPSELNAPRAFPAKTASFVTSKINDLDTLKTGGRSAFQGGELSDQSTSSEPRSSMLATGKRLSARAESLVTPAASANAPCRIPKPPNGLGVLSRCRGDPSQIH
jgi:hypothetical protein